MDNVKGKMSGQTEERQLQQSSSNNVHKEEKRKVSRTWEAAMRYKGSVIVLDPTLYER